MIIFKVIGESSEGISIFLKLVRNNVEADKYVLYFFLDIKVYCSSMF